MASGISIDTRTLAPGDLFVALSTDKNDGHEYVFSAFAKGASAALVRKDWAAKQSDRTKALVAVDDPLAALQRWAVRARAESSYKLIALTGSNGKTTTKEMVAAVLAQRYRVEKTEGNLNNHIGVPLTILRYGTALDMAVIEMGANHVGEIDQLTRIAQPDLALITNIGYGHIGLFGGLENTAAAKFEIINGLRPDGVLLLNKDDPLLVARAKRAKNNVRFFSIDDPTADVYAKDLRFDSDARASFVVDGVAFALAVQGIHMVSNALAAIGVGLFFGIDITSIRDALANFRQPQGRWSRSVAAGILVINDAYNANPSSMRAALNTFARMQVKGRRAAVLGDMLELGAYSEDQHRAIGREAALAGINELCFFGQFAHILHAGALEAGADPRHCRVFLAREEINDYLRSVLAAGDAVLFKASNGVRLAGVAADLERVLAQ